MKEIENISLEFLSVDDYHQLKEAMIESYPSMPNPHWEEKQIKALIKKFPEGQVAIKVNNQVAGCALSLIVDYQACRLDLPLSPPNSSLLLIQFTHEGIQLSVLPHDVLL